MTTHYPSILSKQIQDLADKVFNIPSKKIIAMSNVSASVKTPTLAEFKLLYEAALQVRYNNFLKLKEFDDNYPEYEDILPYNYYEKYRKDKIAFSASFQNKDWEATNFIIAFNEGDFDRCISNMNF